MCRVCSSLGQKWGNERAITGSKIILTCPLQVGRRRVSLLKLPIIRENAAGKRTRKEISLFRAESAKVVSSSDYDA